MAIENLLPDGRPREWSISVARRRLPRRHRDKAGEGEIEAPPAFALAAYFEQRHALATHRRLVRPEALDGRDLDAFTPQVNFDCWVAPLPKQLGVPDSDARRGRRAS
jgi:hypothetical protein